MNTMNMPGFTAEASLCKTSGHYQTSRQAINLPTRMNGTIHLAAIDVPGEVIVIVEDWPPDPWTPPSWGGHGGTGTPSGPSDGGGGGGGGSGSGGTGRPPRPPRERELTPDQAIGELWLMECQKEEGALRFCCNRKQDECNSECSTDSNACKSHRGQCKIRGDWCRAG